MGAAYALMVLGGNQNPTEDDLCKFFKEVGVAVEKEKLAVMLDKMGNSGKTFTELIQEGEAKLMTVSAPRAVAAEENAEVAKEDAKAAPADADAVDPDNEMEGEIFNLFGDDDE